MALRVSMLSTTVQLSVCVFKAFALRLGENDFVDDLQSFDSFVQKWERNYHPESSEYETRRPLYEQRLLEARDQNSKVNRLWTAGVNNHWDWYESEIDSLHGWRRVGSGRAPASLLAVDESLFRGEFPEQVLWADLHVSKTVKNQGNCGSCWAVTASSVLEAHHEIHQGKHRLFSAQELTSCTPNPNECGGTGGCQGSTIELAFEYAHLNGLHTTEEIPYEAKTGSCDSLHSGSLLERRDHTHKSAYASFGMTGWEKLAENKLAPVLQALYEKGPVGASVVAMAWELYKSGIWDSCDKDGVISHAVMLQGYGVDQNSTDKTKYWLIQNSWGVSWGENGYIRLLRSDDEESYCGKDKDPAEGTGCKGGPSEVTICGMCGILYDNSIPHFSTSSNTNESEEDML